MTLEVDVFWSFRSPYSYLATPRLVRSQREYDVDVDVRPVLPIAVRMPGFFEQVNPLWPPLPAARHDAHRASTAGIDYGWPRPDPIVQDFATRKVAAEQPLHPSPDTARRRGRASAAAGCRSSTRSRA